ncbi:hypothetical protein T492DRAFT_888494 [Pavlovales sp. CCMP2436]|nr:hypothetical protein T492DRAFT_888494 [Pavlovales sp. CCMP2436]
MELERLASVACLSAAPGERARALAQLRRLFAGLEHRHRAQCLTKRPVHAMLDTSSGQALLPVGDVKLKPQLLGTGEPYTLAQSAAGVLVTLLEDEHAEVRLEAVDALAALAVCDGALRMRAAELMVDALADDSARVRARALRRLGVLLEGVELEPEHMRAIVGSLDDASAAVRASATLALRAVRLPAAAADEPAAAAATATAAAAGAESGGDSGGGCGVAGALLCEILDALGASAVRARELDGEDARAEVAAAAAAAALGLRHPHLMRALLAHARRQQPQPAHPQGHAAARPAALAAEESAPSPRPPHPHPPPTAALSPFAPSRVPVVRLALTLSALLHAAFASAAAERAAELGAGAAGAASGTVASAAQAAAAQRGAQRLMAPLPAWVWDALGAVAGACAVRVPIGADAAAASLAARDAALRSLLGECDEALAAAARAEAAADAAGGGAALAHLERALVCSADEQADLPVRLPGCEPGCATEAGARLWFAGALATARHMAALRATLAGAPGERGRAAGQCKLAGRARAAARAAREVAARLSGLSEEASCFLRLSGCWALGWLLAEQAGLAAAGGCALPAEGEGAELARELDALERSSARLRPSCARLAQGAAHLAPALRALCAAAPRAAERSGEVNAAVRAAQLALAAHAPHASLPAPAVTPSPPRLRTARVRLLESPQVLPVRAGWPLAVELEVELGCWDRRQLEQCALVARCASHCWRFPLGEGDVVRRRASELRLHAAISLAVPIELVDSELRLTVETTAGSVWAQLGEARSLPTAAYTPSALQVLRRTPGPGTRR